MPNGFSIVAYNASFFFDFPKVPGNLANKDGLFPEFSPEYLNKMRSKSIGLLFFSCLFLELFLMCLGKQCKYREQEKGNTFKSRNKRAFSLKNFLVLRHKMLQVEGQRIFNALFLILKCN